MNSSDRVGSITVYAIGFNKKAAGYVRFILFLILQTGALFLGLSNEASCSLT